MHQMLSYKVDTFPNLNISNENHKNHMLKVGKIAEKNIKRGRKKEEAKGRERERKK